MISIPFAACLVVMFALAGIGAPIALSMIVAAIVYLFTKGQDPGLAAEQSIQGLYDSFVLLAVPLFIVAANIMNQGTISDRLLDFCKAVVGRFRGGLAQVDILVSLIFSGMIRKLAQRAEAGAEPADHAKQLRRSNRAGP